MKTASEVVEEIWRNWEDRSGFGHMCSIRLEDEETYLQMIGTITQALTAYAESYTDNLYESGRAEGVQEGYLKGQTYKNTIAEECRIARAEALEEAAKVAHKRNPKGTNYTNETEEAIRALKEKP